MDSSADKLAAVSAILKGVDPKSDDKPHQVCFDIEDSEYAENKAAIDAIEATIQPHFFKFLKATGRKRIFSLVSMIAPPKIANEKYLEELMAFDKAENAYLAKHKNLKGFAEEKPKPPADLTYYHAFIPTKTIQRGSKGSLPPTTYYDYSNGANRKNLKYADLKVNDSGYLFGRITMEQICFTAKDKPYKAVIKLEEFIRLQQNERVSTGDHADDNDVRADLEALFMTRTTAPSEIAGLLTALVSFAMMFAPLTSHTYIVGSLCYLLATGFCYAAGTAIVYEIIGRAGASASMQYALFTAAQNQAIAYVIWFDGKGYDLKKSPLGLFAFDGGANIIGACFLCGMIFYVLPRFLPERSAEHHYGLS